MDKTIQIVKDIESILSTFDYHVSNPYQKECIRKELNLDKLNTELERIKLRIIDATARGCIEFMNHKV